MVERIVEGVEGQKIESEALAKKNRSSLDKCEATIQKGESAFMAAARAVVKIVDGELFKPWFADKTSYFRDRWEMEKQMLNQFENAGRVLTILENEGYDGDRLPKNGGQCRALYHSSLVDGELDAARLETIWESIVGGEGKITAKLIAEKAKNLFPKKEAEQVQDSATAPTTNRNDDPTFHGSPDEESEDPIEQLLDSPAKCSALVTITLDSTVLGDVADHLGRPCKSIGENEWELEIVDRDIESLMHNLGTWAKAYVVKRIVIRFV